MNLCMTQWFAFAANTIFWSRFDTNPFLWSKEQRLWDGSGCAWQTSAGGR